MGENRIKNVLLRNFGFVLAQLRRQGNHYHSQKDEEHIFVVPITGGMEAAKELDRLVQTAVKADLCPKLVPSFRGKMIEELNDHQAMMVFRVNGGRKLDLRWQEDRKALMSFAAKWSLQTTSLEGMRLISLQWIDALINRCQKLEQLAVLLKETHSTIVPGLNIEQVREENDHFYRQSLETVQKMLKNVGYWQEKSLDDFWSSGFKPLTGHSFWVMPNQQVSLLDFRLLVPGWQMTNLARIIDYIGGKVKWDFDEITYLIDLYEDQSRIAPEDFQAVFTLLSFPNRFYWYAVRLVDALPKWQQQPMGTAGKNLEQVITQVQQRMHRLYLEDKLKSKFIKQWQS